VHICCWQPLQSQTSADWKIRKLILKIRHEKIGGFQAADFFVLEIADTEPRIQNNPYL